MRTLCFTLAALALAAPALSRPRTAPPAASPKAFEAVIDCRSIADSAQRLACYDKSVAALQQAADARDLVVVDREEVKKARRSLFGFNIPNLNIFGHGKGAVEPEEKEIHATVRSAQQDGDGDWIVTLDDGAIWRQTDGQPFALSPRPGDPVTITRAALGSYFMKIGRQPPVKARREG